jgi:formylglycine-generating enzyme required for sulfatase activity
MRGGVEGDAYPWGNEQGPDWLLARKSAGRGIHSADLAGMSPINGYGLMDTGYNIHEWCSDWYDPAYYSRSPGHNPKGPAEGKRRASRGGAWRHSIRVCRNAARSAIPPEFQYSDYGFRLAASV